MPFANTSNDPNTEYLSDGISETLINSLTQLRQLRVIARTTAFRYKGKEIDPRQADAATVLTNLEAALAIARDQQLGLLEVQCLCLIGAAASKASDNGHAAAARPG